jgi:hypothetical protein
MSTNPFDDEWRDCLRAHYIHVVRSGDTLTEPSLNRVLNQVGFSESELAELHVRATMHVDDVPADFVPDLHVLDSVPADEPRFYARVALPVQSAPPEGPPTDAALSADDILEDEPHDQTPEPDLPHPNPDEPQQLSFF